MANLILPGEDSQPARRKYADGVMQENRTRHPRRQKQKGPGNHQTCNKIIPKKRFSMFHSAPRGRQSLTTTNRDDMSINRRDHPVIFPYRRVSTRGKGGIRQTPHGCRKQSVKVETLSLEEETASDPPFRLCNITADTEDERPFGIS